MYNALFLADNGKKYAFGVSGDTVFDMDVGNGVSVSIGTTQGFGQVGQTVENRSVGGRSITVRGAVYRNIQQKKREMRSVFTPFCKGRLVFEGKYYIDVYVKDTPNFSPSKNDGKFLMSLFAPFPFFRNLTEDIRFLRSVEPAFSFPVNYAEPHVFGVPSREKWSNVINDGDVPVPMSVSISTVLTSNNPVITNLRTFQTLRINGTLEPGEVVNIYRDVDGVLRVTLSAGNEITDIFGRLDEDSTLFDLDVGDNILSANDDEGGEGLTVRVSFSPALTAVYED